MKNICYKSFEGKKNITAYKKTQNREKVGEKEGKKWEMIVLIVF